MSMPKTLELDPPIEPVPPFVDLVQFERQTTSMVCRFLKPVLVLSTSRQKGGMQDDLHAVVNYQMCEPGQCPTCKICIEDLDGHLDEHAAELACDPARTATMITSADMNNMGWAAASHRGVTVQSIVTAGVETNAARAGDPATHFEAPGGWQALADMPKPGTINLILLISHRLTRGALVKAGIMATEAKSATLQALGVRSMYGMGLATGTGTDQYAVACPQKSAFTFTEAQAHVMLGQMIADTLSKALRKALFLQCRLTPETRTSVRAVLMRFGGEVDVGARDGDTDAVAAAMGLAAVMDELSWGTLPAAQAPHLIAQQAMLLVRALSRSAVSHEHIEKRLLTSFLAKPDMPFRKMIDLALDLAGD